jgi:GrpB-like predicted nucleotidyltransferase (UPF0157 family)
VIVSSTTRFYYDDQRIALQTSVSGSTETDSRYFVYGNYIDEVLIMGRYLSSTPGKERDLAESRRDEFEKSANMLLLKYVYKATECSLMR